MGQLKRCINGADITMIDLSWRTNGSKIQQNKRYINAKIAHLDRFGYNYDVHKRILLTIDMHEKFTKNVNPNLIVMTSWNENIFRVTGHLCGESTGPRYIPRTKASEAPWPFVLGIRRSPVYSPHKGQWRGALMFSLICVWINGWVNNREAGDLRRYRAHYDVIVMMIIVVGHVFNMTEYF